MTSSFAAGCSIDGTTLNCGDGSHADRLAAFASTQTGTLLSKPLASLDSFKKPADIEKFRKSVESVWQSVNKAERQERIKMRRRQISAEEFEKWSETYDAALSNYDEALTFYRTLVWHGKNGKPAAADE